MWSRRLVLAALLVVLVAPLPSHALFHISNIDEVMSGAGGDPGNQYVEIHMLTGSQNFVANSRLTYFGCDPGHTATVLLLVPGNVANGASGARWIMGSASPIGGITPDFTFPGGLVNACGMVCWGAPVAPDFQPPADPNSWSATDPNNYIDCWAYGGYDGPTKAGATESTAGPAGDGTQSLTRSGSMIVLACPTPTNNAGATGSFGSCSTTTSTTTVTTTSTTTTTAPPPHSKCTSKKLQLSGKKALAILKCHAKEVKKGEISAAPCTATPSEKFSTGWGKAEAHGGCLTTGDETAIEGKVDAFAGDVDSELHTGVGPSGCSAKKLGLAGKKAAAKAKCNGKAVGKGTAVDGDCLTGAEGKFGTGWAKAEAPGNDCLTTGDETAIEGKVDAFLVDLLNELLP
jgi:hypothetical protein